MESKMKMEEEDVETSVSIVDGKLVEFAPYFAHWLPSSSRFIAGGMIERSGKGKLEVMKLCSSREIVSLSILDHDFPIRCGTFEASGTNQSSHQFATGDFSGSLCLWDVENSNIPVTTVKAHSELINAIDGFGGCHCSSGGPFARELATASRDGTVCVWDTRRIQSQVLKFGYYGQDCWCVCTTDKYLACGYAQGNVRIYDIRLKKLLWEKVMTRGVVSIAFSNQMMSESSLDVIVGTLEGEIHVIPLLSSTSTSTSTVSMNRSSVGVKEKHGETIWSISPAPMSTNPLHFVSTAGNGSMRLYEVCDRSDSKGNKLKGRKASVLTRSSVSKQPLLSFEWNHDCPGLFVTSGLDFQVSVGFFTHMPVQAGWGAKEPGSWLLESK